jgi:redox-sensitive bicupin YhaK (pirin superfamily)
MTAGSGIIHQEMPQGDAQGSMHGFQLWANLPASHKMMTPRYQEVTSRAIPAIQMENGAEVRLIAGNFAGVQAPVRDIVIDPLYIDVRLPAKTTFYHAIPAGHTVFAYVIEGQATFCQEEDPYSYEMEGANYFDTQRSIGNESLVLFDDGDAITVTTADQAARFLLISGKPIREPVAWYGPIVMNTQAELRTAFQELQDGTFIKVGA